MRYDTKPIFEIRALVDGGLGSQWFHHAKFLSEMRVKKFEKENSQPQLVLSAPRDLFLQDEDRLPLLGWEKSNLRIRELEHLHD